MKNKYFLILVVAVAAIMAMGIIGMFVVQRQTLSNSESFRLNVMPTTTYSELVDSLDAHQAISNHATFGTISRLLRVPSRMRTGSYLIQPGGRTVVVLRKIVLGNQDPVRVTINKHRTIHQLCQFLDSKLMFSSDTLESMLLNDTVCSKYGLTPKTILCLFPQNTYEFYWTISPSDFLDKMNRESEKFWQERQAQLKNLGLSREQVVTLASIVEEETNCNEEKPNIASVYLNRLNIGMPLQADPTVKYAIGDFSIRRIKGEMLQTDSPYNTYRYAGLPPGPICIPSVSSIESVLKNKKTDFLFFCAKEDFSGRHNFASTIAEHMSNAKKFHKALNDRNI